MALILKQGFSIQDFNKKDFSNYYGVIDQLNINKSSRECYFVVDYNINIFYEYLGTTIDRTLDILVLAVTRIVSNTYQAALTFREIV